MKPYEFDPEYEAARAAYVRSYPDASSAFKARLQAAAVMERIEAAYNADPGKFRQYEMTAWAQAIATSLPPFTEQQARAVRALAAQIDQRIAERHPEGPDKAADEE